MNGIELVKFYEKDRTLSKYLHIIRDSPVYPVIFDSKRTVLSLPPVINSQRTKISPKTRNIFFEITATDKTKLEIVNNILVTMFSLYTEEPFTVEPVKIVSKHNNETRQVPDLTPRETEVEISYINSCTGLDLSAEEMCKYLSRMAYIATPSKSSKDLLDISVPATRADVLQASDVCWNPPITTTFKFIITDFSTWCLTDNGRRRYEVCRTLP